MSDMLVEQCVRRLGPTGTTVWLASWVVLAGIAPATAQTNFGWPDTIDLLAQERSQADTCADLLKSDGDKAAVTAGRITYNAAKAKADGVIAGFTIALVEGGKPEELPKILANLERAGAGLAGSLQLCSKGRVLGGRDQGVVEDIAKGAVGPLVDAIKSTAGALWTRHVEKDKLEVETIKAQLEAAKWPDLERFRQRNSFCLMTFRVEKARRNRWERVAALCVSGEVGSGVC